MNTADSQEYDPIQYMLILNEKIILSNILYISPTHGSSLSGRFVDLCSTETQQLNFVLILITEMESASFIVIISII